MFVKRVFTQFVDSDKLFSKLYKLFITNKVKINVGNRI